jgi:hypothetical protein
MIDTILSLVEAGKLYGIDLINPIGLTELFVRFTFNLLVSTIIIRYLYYPTTKRKDYLFTFVMLSTTIFLLIFMLESVKMKIGFALGLFAIFGIIRYRTNPIPIKEMTYLFVVITVSVINGMTSKKISYAELITTNLIIVSVVFIIEKLLLLRHETSKRITYEKIELIKPEKRKELIADLEERTGIKISRVEIGRINFLQDTARVKIFFYENEQQNFLDEDYYDDGDDD